MQATWRTGFSVCAALLILSRVSPASPASLRSLTVEGASVFTPREVLSWLTSRPDQPYAREVFRSDLGAIREQYRLRGYLAASASIASETYSADSTRVDVVLRIDEGKETVLGAIRLEGASAIPEADLLSTFDSRPGMPLDQSQLEQDIESVINRYEKAGYPLVSCRIADLAHREGTSVDTMDVRLSIDEGKRVTIDEIRVRGNKETDPSVVVRETRLNAGELYNPSKVQAIRQRLVRLNIFSSVEEPQLFLHGDRGGLLISVREGSTNTFDGVLGYLPQSSDGRGGYFTGLVSVAMRNLFGTGRKLSVRWQREDRFSQELGFQYVEPWVASLPVNIGAGFSQRQQDSAYVRRNFNLNSELMLSEELSVGAVVEEESVIPSADSTAVRASRSSTRSIGGTLLYDTRDDIYSPTGGARYHLDYHYGRKKIEATPGITGFGPSNVAVQRLGFDFEVYLPAFARQVVALGAHGRDVQGGRIEESELFRFGGTNSLRGYRENQFLASRVVWLNNEYRFLLGRRTYFFGFIDAGYYLRPADDLHNLAKVEALKYGYGIGIRLDTSLGNLGLSFALGQGDTFSTTKVHFGLLNEF